MSRAIDDAMGLDCPAKDFLRKRWVDLVRQFKDAGLSDGGFLYLSLPGKHGRDIQALIDSEILEVTETGALTEESQDLVAAVESNGRAVVELQRKYSGLKIYEKSIHDLLRGGKLTTFPDGRDKRFAGARIINLDFDKPVHDDPDNPEKRFPVVNLIKKIGLLHKEEGHATWALCITFNSTLQWAASSIKEARSLIVENIHTHSEFRDMLSECLGEEALVKIEEDEGFFDAMNDLDFSQRFLSAFIPKRLGYELLDQKWLISVSECYRYYSPNGAPMASWVFVLKCPEEDGEVNKLTIYRKNVLSILRKFLFIDEDGRVGCD